MFNHILPNWKNRLRGLGSMFAIIFLSGNSVHATTFYVSSGNPNPEAPYTNWISAATNIQDAIALASSGDTVLVTNGVYAYGGAVMAGNLTNRIALTNAITVQSVNGPWTTVIAGAGMTNGNSAVRCAWLTNGASLVGFTLTAGATRTSGDTFTLQSGGGVWCATSNAYVKNCVITLNTANQNGGGVYQGTLTACLIRTNAASFVGGASYKSVLNHCTVISNGTYGVASPLAMTNTIVYYNGLGNNYISVSGTAFSRCCTTPALSGTGNFTTAPALFADGVHLASNSPCISGGVNIAATTDIFGTAFSNPPSVGCAEWTSLPVITAPSLKLLGNPVGFSVGNFLFSSTTPCGFRWIKDGIPLSDDSHFSGTQTTNLVAVGVSFSDAGNYQVVVSNSFGMTTSSVVTLKIRVVDVNGVTPLAPYVSWATAATNIQDAITAAAAGDVILVTNGVYNLGGKSMDGIITNRVTIDKAILVQSINGANATVIQGAWDTATTNGPGAIRCVWMTNNAVISGFTLRGGATRSVTASPNVSMYGGGVFATSNNAVVANSLLITNYASYVGGGAYSATLVNCTLTGNHAVGSGTPGSGVANAGVGGGAKNCILLNCVLTGNFADQGNGGGADNCTLKNCALTKNSTYFSGGAVNGGSLVNCTIVSNYSSGYSSGNGGAVFGATATNCIIFNNISRTSYPNTNYASSSLTYCCADPLPTGTGNTNVNPQLVADGFHLTQTSPCIAAGTSNAVSATDIDGQPWSNPPPIGCDEWNATPIITLPPALQVGSPTHALSLAVAVAGQSPFNYFWNKDGALIQNDLHHTNSNTANLTVKNFGPEDAGNYTVVVTNSSGMATSPPVLVVIHAVDTTSLNPVAPYSSWSNAAIEIQDAIHVASAGDIVLVTNGIYATGGFAVNGDLTNRVVINKPIVVISVNGHQSTVIQGKWDPISTNGLGAERCVWIGGGGVLSGFTLRSGATRATSDILLGSALRSGGGAWCNSSDATILNCLFTNNAAIFGGGVANGKIYNSLLDGNIAQQNGGGAFSSTLNNCTVINNQCLFLFGGAGTYSATVRNSIVVGNYDQPFFQTDNYNSASASSFFNSCSSSGLSPTTGNINTSPRFLDEFHLSTTSPCYGTGSGTFASGYDLDGEPWNTPPSMGCDEIVTANLTGPLTASIVSAWTNILINRPFGYMAAITGRAAYVSWSFGDGPIFTNFGAGASHQWTNGGDYTVTATVYNNDNPSGISASLPVHVQSLVATELIPAMQTNGFGFQFAGQNLATYTVQYATNLASPINWQTLQTIYFNNQTNIQIFDNTQVSPMRFYRIMAQ